MRYRRFLVLAAVAGLLALGGCVSARLNNSKTLAAPATQPPLERVVLAVRPSGADKSGGADLFDELLPHLAERLPKVFVANGLDTRVLGVSKFGPDDEAWKGPSLRVLTVTPLIARATKRAGQVLRFRAVLLDPAKNAPLWRADLSVTSKGDPNDDRIADELAVKLLEALRADHMARATGEAVRLP